MPLAYEQLLSRYRLRFYRKQLRTFLLLSVFLPGLAVVVVGSIYRGWRSLYWSLPAVGLLLAAGLLHIEWVRRAGRGEWTRVLGRLVPYPAVLEIVLWLSEAFQSFPVTLGALALGVGWASFAEAFWKAEPLFWLEEDRDDLVAPEWLRRKRAKSLLHEETDAEQRIGWVLVRIVALLVGDLPGELEAAYRRLGLPWLERRVLLGLRTLYAPSAFSSDAFEVSGTHRRASLWSLVNSYRQAAIQMEDAALRLFRFAKDVLGDSGVLDRQHEQMLGGLAALLEVEGEQLHAAIEELEGLSEPMTRERACYLLGVALDAGPEAVKEAFQKRFFAVEEPRERGRLLRAKRVLLGT